MRPRVTSLSFTLLLLACPAVAGDWFMHPFGELRAFHKDWLAVCDNQGDGPCRVVRAEADPGAGSFFDQRLSIKRGADGWTIEIMDRGLPEQSLERLTFSFAQESYTLAPGQWTPGEGAIANVAETVTLIDPDVTAEIIAAMRAGLEMEITYRPPGTGDGRGQFPLRGLSAAMDAVAARVEAVK